MLSPRPALTCTEFSCQSALTFHLLGTEQKRCWDFSRGFFQGFRENEQLTTVVKSGPRMGGGGAPQPPNPRHSVNTCRSLKEVIFMIFIEGECKLLNTRV